MNTTMRKASGGPNGDVPFLAFVMDYGESNHPREGTQKVLQMPDVIAQSFERSPWIDRAWRKPVESIVA